ncbi:MAG: CaiB/BaiF CoA transferase family protein, partial [Thermaurantiacus tibetensis]
MGALEGLRVLEAGTLIAGPFCGQLLADHGAEVIKIEPPPARRPGGDPMRQWGQGKPVWFPVIARNKKTITLDLSDPRGQALVRRLVRRADIMVENFRPGTLEGWNLGWEALRAENPGLILVRVSGYGQTGPYARRAGFGAIGEAMGGLRALVGEPDRPPARVGISIGDSLAATFACLGALMALHHRHRTGEGQVVDSAIYEAVLAVMESTVPEYTEAGVVRERSGSILPGNAPSNVYPCRDGEILIGANQDGVFRRLCEAMGAPELARDPRYATHAARGANQAELDARIAAWTGGLAVAEALARLEAAGVPAGRLYRVPDMLEDPHFAAREALVAVPHP